MLMSIQRTRLAINVIRAAIHVRVQATQNVLLAPLGDLSTLKELAWTIAQQAKSKYSLVV
jgi:hypothetical protein